MQTRDISLDSSAAFLGHSNVSLYATRRVAPAISDQAAELGFTLLGSEICFNIQVRFGRAVLGKRFWAGPCLAMSSPPKSGFLI